MWTGEDIAHMQNEIVLTENTYTGNWPRLTILIKTDLPVQ